MLNQPTSSPMMTRILGFLVCACAGARALKSAAVLISSDKPLWIKFLFIFVFLCHAVWLLLSLNVIGSGYVDPASSPLPGPGEGCSSPDPSSAGRAPQNTGSF